MLENMRNNNKENPQKSSMLRLVPLRDEPIDVNDAFAKSLEEEDVSKRLQNFMKPPMPISHQQTKKQQIKTIHY